MGPLEGVKIVEFAGIGPVPFCAMLLSDMGAEIIRIDRKGERSGTKYDVTGRGRQSVALDIKNPRGLDACLRLIERADILIEGFRPGVMERLGLGPNACLEINPKLVYGRMTGWGQDGPLAKAAGHDINYIALSGVLHAIGPAHKKPLPPLNLVGDFGGGALYLALGVVAALFEARQSKKGQVVDAAMTDGSASLLASHFGYLAQGIWKTERGTNFLDGGAHFYNSYETADGKFIAIGSIEPKFYALLRQHANLVDNEFDHQMDPHHWPQLKEKLDTVFKTKTRQEWCDVMEGTDVCFAPVLSMEEAGQHAHNRARQTIVEIDGVAQPAPAPRFSRTPSAIQGPPPETGADTQAALLAWGCSQEEIEELKTSNAI